MVFPLKRVLKLTGPGAGVYIDVIVAGTIVAHVPEGLGQVSDQLLVEGSRHLGGLIAAVQGDNIVVLAAVEACDEVSARTGPVFLGTPKAAQSDFLLLGRVVRGMTKRDTP